MNDSQRTIDFFYPAEWRHPKNPLAVGINQQNRDWALETGLIGPQETEWIGMQEAFDLEAFAACVYPLTRDVDFLRFVSDFTLWISVLDDDLERRSLSMGDQERTELVRECHIMLEGGDAPGQIRYAAAFRDIIARFQRLAGEEHGPGLTPWFISTLKQMVTFLVLEESKASLSWQDNAFYEAVRPLVSQFLYYCMFVQIVDECYLPKAVAQDERIQRLATQASLIFGLMNDALSAVKEDTGQPDLNAVLIHKHREGCSDAEALAAVARWHNERVGKLVQTSREAAQSFGAFNQNVESYARGIQNCLRGIIEWGFHSRRYTLPTSCQIRIVSELGPDAPTLLG
jgi:hypothetical protein